MSRIDEALRRAERDESRDGSVATVIQPVAAVTSVLERYVPERPSPDRASSERPASDRAAAPHANAAPASTTTGDAVRVGAVAPPPIVGRRLPVQGELRGKLVGSPDMDSVSLEQYRRMAAVLDALQAERGLKCLMVTSAFPQEGKTLTATNLAITLSEAYKRRVLLIDADFHRPSAHELLRIPNDTGLAELLRSTDARLASVPVSPTLAFVPAGRANSSPIAALSSDRMKAIIAEAMAAFDWVILDTPPVGLLTDAQLIARVTEGVLFVVAAGVTPYQMVQRTIADLGPERIVGTVLNRADRQAIPTGEYYGHYYAVQP